MKLNLRDKASEFVVIFMSIVLAFLFDDFREYRNERSKYKEALVLYANDLSEEMWSVKSKLDTFYVSEIPWSGKDYAELLDLMWFDSLMDIEEVRISHLKYMLNEGRIGTDIRSIVERSPLSQEIRTKHNEQASRSVSMRLRVYDMQMDGLDAAVDQIHSLQEKLGDQISHIDIYGDSLEHESVLVFSNEFKWYYKELVSLIIESYQYKNYLVSDRFIKVAEGIVEEIDKTYLFPVNPLTCYKIQSLVARCECEEGFVPEAPIPVEDIVKKRRKNFIESF